MSAIVPSIETTPKKKRKSSSKKKTEIDTISNQKYKCQPEDKEGSTPEKVVDVYEFLDNDAEVFEFRPSTLMERFKSITNKEAPSTPKFHKVLDEAENTNESASDGDDFVYMSDDYVCSDEETENSLLSCEIYNNKTGSDIKKNVSPLKRKDVVDKNAVMGKIFKHNAVRTDKKSLKAKETTKPKADLDQLFDSLLEDEPKSSSILNNDAVSPRKDVFVAPKSYDQSSKYDKYNTSISSKDEFSTPKKSKSPSPKRIIMSSPKVNDSSLMDYGPSTSKKYDSYGPSTSKSRDINLSKDFRPLSPMIATYDSMSSRKHDALHYTSVKHSNSSSTKFDDISHKASDRPHSRDKLLKEKSPPTKLDEDINTSYVYSVDTYDQIQYDDLGVARQRARRKCTVGKQNVLAETWSSESEPDGVPPRPNSAESVVLSSARRKKGKKRDVQHSGARRANNRHISFRKQDADISVPSYDRNVGTVSGARGSRADRNSADRSRCVVDPYLAPTPSTSHAPSTPHMPLGLPGTKPRPRSTSYYWSSEGDEEQEHLQQHGWIVGDSHKKLVTMLAHAKGRKRNNEDKHSFVE